MNSKIVVTGGAGFIGSNLLRYLTEESVVVYDNLSRGHRSNIPDNVAFIEGDIRDQNALNKALINSDSVIHLAAFGSVIESINDPSTNFDINVNGFRCVLEACRRNGVRRVILASTGGALIGDAKLPVNELSLPKPISPYGASKLCCEAYCHAYAKSYGLQTIALRFANIYGPYSGHKRGAITRFMKAIMKNEPIIIFGDGSATRDYLYSGDLCEGITRVLTADLSPGEVLHLASGIETSVKDLAKLICSVAGAATHPIHYLPERLGEVHRNFASFDKAKSLIGFQPMISLNDGIAETWEWFLKNRDSILSIAETDS